MLQLQTTTKTIPEDVALELFAQGITLHFLRDSLIHESTATRSTNPKHVLQLVLIVDVDGLLRTESGIANVKLQQELAKQYS